MEILSCEGTFETFFTDAFVYRLLAANPLGSLRIFDIGGVAKLGPRLTRLSAERLLSLPMLQELRLKKWRLSADDFQSLEEKIRDNAWDVRLIGPEGQPPQEEIPPGLFLA